VGLWTKSDLRKFFEEKGIFHPDDMSGIILTSYHRRLNGKHIALSDQINRRQQAYMNIEKRNDTLIYPNVRANWDEEFEEFRKLFATGDTVMIAVSASEKKLFQTYASSVPGYAVIKDTNTLDTEIIEIKYQKGHVPQWKVGDTLTVSAFNVIWIPPKNWLK